MSYWIKKKGLFFSSGNESKVCAPLASTLPFPKGNFDNRDAGPEHVELIMSTLNNVIVSILYCHVSNYSKKKCPLYQLSTCI